MIVITSGLSLKKMTRKYGAITSMVSGVVVEPMSSIATPSPQPRRTVRRAG
jgi:Na+/proline symporter